MDTWASLAAAALLAAVHLGGRRLLQLARGRPQFGLSLAAGVSVAYVFLHILPELEESNARLAELLARPEALVTQHHAWLTALAGLIGFYALEHLVRAKGKARGAEVPWSVFWVHIGAFALYNAVIGYLLVHRVRPGEGELALFTTAMALHFLVNDAGFRRDHPRTYARAGRWVLSGAVLLGWAVGAATAVSELGLELLLGLLSGSIIFNVLKEELPESRESRPGAFVLGAAVYSVLLLAL